MPAGAMTGRPRRILLSADAVGGVWQYSLELAQGFSRRGIAVILAVLGPSPADDLIARAGEIETLSLVVLDGQLDWTAATPADVERSAASLSALAAREEADLIHLHSPALAGATRWPAPVIVTAHSCLATWWRTMREGPMPSDFVWRVEQTAAGMRSAEAIIAPSRSFAMALAEAYGSDIPVIPIRNGRTPAHPAAVCREALIFTAGRLWDEGKNMIALDHAAALHDLRIFAAGSDKGPHGASIALPHLTLLGRLNDADVTGWHHRASVYASTALYEPFGLSVLEAAQAGCVLVLSDIPTFRELWGGAAYFVPPDDPDAIGWALRHVLAEPYGLASRGADARTRADRYGSERMTAETLDAYGAVLAKRHMAAE
ncbi:glycosyltransferase family 4 protein [Inquilinus sp. CAU 1745]|uniref:glycosyltransferase family 4 protein n=1 Tax=Inquilinus sp. CAU 1745 TaxID=3140369 RepID=UPI00325AB1DE